MAELHNLTGRVNLSGGALISFIGPPNKAIAWRVISGVATLTPITVTTDEGGRALARFDALTTGVVVIGVAYVP